MDIDITRLSKPVFSNNDKVKVILETVNDSFWDSNKFVFVNFNLKFFNEAKQLIKSLIRYNKDFSIICFIDEHSEEKENKLLLLDCGICVTVIDFIIPNNVVRFYPPISVFRIIVPHLLNPKIKNVLYLDTDIICHGSFESIYSDYCNNTISIVPDISLNINEVRLFKQGEAFYGNAGVILINTEKYREVYTFEDIYYKSINMLPKLAAQDQDFLNLLFHNHISYLPINMNFLAKVLIRCNLFDKMYKDNIIFYHFASPKPWKFESSIRVTKIYYLNLMNDKKGYFIARLNIFKKQLNHY